MPPPNPPSHLTTTRPTLPFFLSYTILFFFSPEKAEQPPPGWLQHMLQQSIIFEKDPLRGGNPVSEALSTMVPYGVDGAGSRRRWW